MIALLRQRSRVTYRTLQRQFQLDEAALNDLKEALLYAYTEVRDEGGHGLVWTAVRPAPPPGEPHRPEAESRFHAVLPEVLAVLQRDRRVTYRRLTYLFGLDEALAVLDTTEARVYAAELYRLQGAVLLQQAVPEASQAEACFQQALDVARQQQAKSWELRAATSLARLWQSQDKRQDAYDLLAPVYHWFTEGFDTADLQEAKALLAELGN